jgi:uncharacterized protein (TIGR02246 family)
MRLHARSGWVLGALASAAAGCAAQGAPPADAAAVRQQIEKTSAAFAAAVSRGDPAAVGAVFATDAVLLMSNAEPVIGRDRIVGHLKAVLAGATETRYVLATDEVEVFGDAAFERGHYTLSMKLQGRPVQDRGKYLAIWKRQPDGAWQIYRDIDNTSLPLPPPPLPPPPPAPPPAPAQ